jgi:outer membrane lipoprotein SlyB
MLLIPAVLLLAGGIVAGVSGGRQGWLALAVGAVLVSIVGFLRIVQLSRQEGVRVDCSSRATAEVERADERLR